MSYLVNMLPHEIHKAIQERWPLIIPSGCIEFHGNHLPLGTDLIIPEEIIRKVEPFMNIVICPSIGYGPTGYCIGGPETGTLDVDANVFKSFAKEVLLGLYKTGFREIIVLQHHQGPDGPQGSAWKMAAAEILNEYYRIYGTGWYSNNYGKNDALYLKVTVLGSTPEYWPWPGSHGALGETEPMLALKPDAVDMGRLVKDDFPWNWQPGKEADLSSKEQGNSKVDAVVRNWFDYLQVKFPQTKKERE